MNFNIKRFYPKDIEPSDIAKHIEIAALGLSTLALTVSIPIYRNMEALSADKDLAALGVIGNVALTGALALDLWFGHPDDGDGGTHVDYPDLPNAPGGDGVQLVEEVEAFLKNIDSPASDA